MEAYIVYFNTGSYNDSTKEIRRIFLSEDKANLYCADLNNQLKELGLYDYNSKGCIRQYDHDLFSKDLLDKFGFMICSYSGAWFTVDSPYEIVE